MLKNGPKLVGVHVQTGKVKPGAILEQLLSCPKKGKAALEGCGF